MTQVIIRNTSSCIVVDDYFSLEEFVRIIAILNIAPYQFQTNKQYNTNNKQPVEDRRN